MTQFEDPSNIDNFLKGTEYDIFGQADRPSLNNQLFGLRDDQFVPNADREETQTPGQVHGFPDAAAVSGHTIMPLHELFKVSHPSFAPAST